MGEFEKYQGKELAFQNLMLHRIHEILLVASPYDAFILEEDGRLTEQILHEYLGMNLSYAPRVWNAPTARKAMDMLSKRPFDLIIVMLRISDMDPISFGTQIKAIYPKKPVILLTFDESEIKQLPDNYSDSIDDIFIWSGNANVFPAIIKCIEDKKNVKRDVKKGDVRSIILIEDTPRFYSIILPLIYKEILFHTKQLIDKSLNDTHRLLHMRGRPKILLANTYEQAEKYFKRYRANTLGIISDIRFPHKGKLQKDAGIEFAQFVRSIDKTLPILLHSTEENIENKASKVKASFLNKNSSTLLQDLREFIVNNLGFGDFVFRYPDNTEISKATSVRDLVEVLETLDMKSLTYHASNNHFSNWLAARGEFKLASFIRQLSDDDFDHPEERREMYIDIIRNSQRNLQTSQVVEFASSSHHLSTNFSRLGKGSLGGKARGLAFANTMLAKPNWKEKFPDVNIRVPHVVVVGTEEFDNFMDKNDLWNIALSSKHNDEITEIFLKGRLSRDLIVSLKSYLKDVHHPIAVRSSSLLEDSQYQPLAGIYSTYMLPNCSENNKERLSQVCEAIKRIFASTFFQEPKTLMDNIVQRHEEEKMAVIIMELVGKTHNNRFYPTCSGVAQSYNYYPVSYMQREEGIAFVALGLGRTIVEGGKALRFSPKYPAILPQFYSIKATINSSQNDFFALELNCGENPMRDGEPNNLKQSNIALAESDGVLKWLGSTVCSQDNMIRDSLKYEGTRVITFAPMLKWETFPIADIINEMLDMSSHALGCPVEIEFAINIYNDPDKKDEFCLLQIKPMVIGGLQNSELLLKSSNKEPLCKSDIVLGDGIIDYIKHIVYVDPELFDVSKTQEIAREIEVFNDALGTENPYLLIGPGRWGTADPWLGIPVTWKQISHAKVIVEVGTDKLNPDPSFGSHFFQNVTSLRIGYFTIRNQHKHENIDCDWLKKQSVKEKSKFLKLIELDYPIFVRIDGRSGDGVILKPSPPEVDIMDEEESTGI